MDEIKKRLSQKKRNRPQSPIKEESPIFQKYNIKTDKSEYVVSIKLLNEKNSILIKCSPKANLTRFELTLKLLELKDKNRIFHICHNIKDAFKIFTNFFNKKKAKIVEDEENNDCVNLIISVPNYIENTEDNISFNLLRNKNINLNINNPSINSDDIDNNKVSINNIFKENNGVNLGLDLIEKISNLSKNDLEKETKIQKLIIHFNQSLEEIKKIKKDIKKIKKHIGISDISDKDENEEENENEEDEDKINEENDEEKEEDDMDNSDEDNYNDNDNDNGDEKEESKLSRYKYNEIKEEEYQNKEDIQTLKDKLSKTLVTINEKNTQKENGPKIKLNLVPTNKSKEQMNLKLNNSNISKNSYPQLSFYKNLTKKTTSKYYGDNNFIVFESLNKEIILVYSANRNSIQFFDIEQDKLLKNIADAHKCQINNFRYARDKNESRDLVLSIADKAKNLKIWDIKTYICILNLENIYFDGFLFSSCFLIDEINNKNYILTVNFNSEPLKIYNFEGINIRNINNNDDKSYIIDTIYNSYQNKHFIIVGNENFIISYYFENGEIYKKYFDYTSDTSENCVHMFFTINFKDTDIFLIEADLVGYLRIWNFDTGILLKKYLIGEKLKLRGISLWNENYVFVGASDKNVKLIDLKSGEILDNLKCNEIICNIKKIKSRKFGECLLLQGKSNSGQIKLWKNIN